jgi:hypothetical protein
MWGLGLVDPGGGPLWRLRDLAHITFLAGWHIFILLSILSVGLISMLDAGGRNFRVSKVRARMAFMYGALIVYGLIAD